MGEEEAPLKEGSYQAVEGGEVKQKLQEEAAGGVRFFTSPPFRVPLVHPMLTYPHSSTREEKTDKRQGRGKHFCGTTAERPRREKEKVERNDLIISRRLCSHLRPRLVILNVRSIIMQV